MSIFCIQNEKKYQIVQQQINDLNIIQFRKNTAFYPLLTFHNHKFSMESGLENQYCNISDICSYFKPLNLWLQLLILSKIGIKSVCIILFMNSQRTLQTLNEKLPDWEKAEAHAKSIMVGKAKPSNYEIEEGGKRCECCGQAVDKEPIALCENTKQLQFIGIGFPLFFVFFKYCIIFLLLVSASVSVMQLSVATEANFGFYFNGETRVVPHLTEEVNCTSVFVFAASISDNVGRNDAILRGVYFVTTLLFLVYMRDALSKLIGYYDERTTTFSDYSFLLKNLPKTPNIRKDIAKMLADFQVCKVVVIGTFEHIEKMIEEIQGKKRQQNQLLIKISEISDKDELKEKYFNQLNSIGEKRKQLCQVFQKIAKNELKLYALDLVYPQKIIITVETDQQKETIIQRLQEKNESTFPSGWNGQAIEKLYVSEAPQPKEIIWSNLNFPLEKKVRNYMIGWGATFLLLAVITTIFYFGLVSISSMVEKQEKQQGNTAKGLFYSILVCILLINKFLISPVLNRICVFQKYFTKTEEEYGFTLKYLLCMFFTTAVMTVLVEAITKHNIFAHTLSVVQSESVMIILTSFLSPLIWLLNPWALLIVCRQRLARNNRHLTQEEANHIMEPMAYQMGKRYADIMKLIWLVSFYQSLIPTGPPVAALGLMLYYWIDKYNLLRRSSVKEAVSGALTLKIMTLLDFSLVLKCGGELFFDFLIRYDWSVLTLVYLVVSFIYFLLPKDKILNYIHGENFKSEQQRFSDCSHQLGQSYEDLHPVLGKKMQKLIQSFAANDERQFYSNTNSITRSILNHPNIMESEKVNSKLKAWKQQFMRKNFNLKQHLLYHLNRDVEDI